MSWNDERIETLRKLWERGLSASQIAEELGGVTRNAVIGKAHRLGLKARPSPVKNEPVKKAAAAEKPSVPAAATPAPAPRKARTAAPTVQKPQRVTLLDLTDRICKWPFGHPDEDDFHFCGKPVNPGTPYCLEHCAEAYQAQLPRRDRRPPPPTFGRPR